MNVEIFIPKREWKREKGGRGKERISNRLSTSTSYLIFP